MNTGKTALVMGGSGFIGSRMVQALASAGWRVRVGTRNIDRARQTKIYGEVGQVVPLRLPLGDSQRLEAAMQGVTLVVNCVGILNEFGAQTFTAVQRDGAIGLARLAASAGVREFIHVSSIAADANSDSGYARTKAEADAGVLSYMPQATILRPSLVFGPEDAFFNRFADMARVSPILPAVGDGSAKFQPVYVEDVVAAAMAALTSPSAKGTIFELGGPSVYSFKELLEFIIDHVHRRRRVVHIPESLAAFIAMMTAWLPNPPLSNDQLKLLKQDTVVRAGARTLQDLGIAARSVEAIVPAYLQQYRPGGRFETEVVRV